MPNDVPTGDKRLEFTAAFEVMSPAHRDAVVARALLSRSEASPEAGSAFNSAIQKNRIRVTGYRDSLRAPHTLLREPVSLAVSVSNELAGAVLKVWSESEVELRAKSVEYLSSVGIPSRSSEFSFIRFQEIWPLDDLHSHRDKFVKLYSDGTLDQDDAALMLCLVAGRAPAVAENEESEDTPGTVSEFLSQVTNYLQALPPAAPEWQATIPGFISSLSNLVASKALELKWVDDFEAILREVGEEFGELLAFFEQDTHTWTASRVSRTADSAAALATAQELKALLAQYLPLHERAASFSEERDRAKKREELQTGILECVRLIDGLMTGNFGELQTASSDAPLPDNKWKIEQQLGIAAVGAQEPPPANSLQEALTAAEPASDEHVVEERSPSSSTFQLVALQSENVGLRDNARTLSVENQDLRDEVEALKTELYSSQEREDSWRLAYRSAVGGTSEVLEEPAPEVDTVNDAVELAKSRFRQELVFAPNSDSTIEENPFTDPMRVWEALQWLGTTYYASKMGRLRITDFDQSIKEACGWWYKGDQGETTLSRYEKSYTTRVDGKRHWLAEHIGKGTSFDARYTIRIAFVWDRDRRQVIVGYVGRHQQTDAS